MPVKFADHISCAGVGSTVTLVDQVPDPNNFQRVPARIATLLAKVGVKLPPAGQKLSIDELDAAIEEVAVPLRLSVKAELHQLGIID